jgi:hypothetical protein
MPMLINVDSKMSSPKYTLPCPVYLPSSGGHTSSRLASEVSFTPLFAPAFETTHSSSIQPFHQRVFAFRRYSVEEDGRLVARTRNAGHSSYVLRIHCSCRAFSSTDIAPTSRPKPYERPSKPATLQSSNRDIPQASQESHSRKQVDGATLSRLFQQLMPLTADPATFESRATAICAAFNLDSTTSTEIVSSFKQRSRADSSQESRCV